MKKMNKMRFLAKTIISSFVLLAIFTFTYLPTVSWLLKVIISPTDTMDKPITDQVITSIRFVKAVDGYYE